MLMLIEQEVVSWLVILTAIAGWGLGIVTYKFCQWVGKDL